MSNSIKNYFPLRREKPQWKEVIKINISFTLAACRLTTGATLGSSLEDWCALGIGICKEGRLLLMRTRVETRVDSEVRKENGWNCVFNFLCSILNSFFMSTGASSENLLTKRLQGKWNVKISLRGNVAQLIKLSTDSVFQFYFTSHFRLGSNKFRLPSLNFSARAYPVICSLLWLRKEDFGG